MAVKPVKFISDVEIRKRILKTDSSGTVLFSVSGTAATGSVETVLPITASSLYITNDAEINGTLYVKRIHTTEITNSVYYEDSLSASINALVDVSASNAKIGDVLRWDGSNWIADTSLSGSFTGSLNGTATYAITAAYAENAANAVLSINDLIDVSASNAAAGQYFKFDGTNWVASEISGIGVSRQQYIQLRYNASGSFINDTVELELPPSFTTDSIKYISFNLLTRTDAESNWRNDLASVEFKISGSSVWAVISAPSLPQEYTFNAVNDNPNEVQQAVIVNEYTDVFVSDNLTLSGAALPNLNITGTVYNAADAFSKINEKFGIIENSSEQKIGNFDIDGEANVQLNNYNFIDLDYITVDVMIQAFGSSTYTNDLISIELSGNIDTNKVHVILSAPTMTVNDKYRIIVNKIPYVS